MLPIQVLRFFLKMLAILLAGSRSPSPSLLCLLLQCVTELCVYVYIYTYNGSCQKLSLSCPHQLKTTSSPASQHVLD